LILLFTNALTGSSFLFPLTFSVATEIILPFDCILILARWSARGTRKEK
jgi:hypothetical protein